MPPQMGLPDHSCPIDIMQLGCHREKERERDRVRGRERAEEVGRERERRRATINYQLS